MRGNDVIAHRVIMPRLIKIGGVKGFIPNSEIGTVAKGVHHRSRQISGAGPHGDAHNQSLFHEFLNITQIGDHIGRAVARNHQSTCNHRLIDRLCHR